jgi:Methyltransferase domain
MTLPAFAPRAWQMSYGERCAFEGLLAQTKPRLAVEIGTAEGGSLQRIATHSDEVHSFDLVPPLDEVAALANVTFHTGDSHRLVPEFLARAAEQALSIDFVLIDGDHSAEGVRRDIIDVLGSDAVKRTVIVLHDTLNPEVRRGIEAAAIAQHPKVALFELDLVPGYLARREPYRLQLWGGLGLVVVDAEYRQRSPGTVRDDRFHELSGVIRPTVELMQTIEARGTALDGLASDEVEFELRSALTEMVTERDRLAARLNSIERSRGWRLVLVYRQLRNLIRGR